MSVVLNHPINGHSATSVDPDYVVFPSAQEIVINSVNDSISIGGTTGNIAIVTPAGALTVTGTLTTIPSGTQDVNVISSVLPTGAATQATLATRLSETDFDSKTGSLTESAPATDTASSGLNGRLQRIAQRLTSLIALVPASLGQKNMANSFAVAIASDQSNVPVSQATASALNAQVVGNIASNAADSGNPVKVGGIVNVTANTFANGVRADAQMDTSGSVYVNTSGRKATYSAGVSNLAVAALTTDFFTITGSATTIVKVTKITFQSESTANAVPELILLKRSTANSGGTSTTATAVPNDSADAAATAVVRSYTANPTLGTLVGFVRAVKFFSSGASSQPAEPVIFEFGNNHSKPIVLRGTGEVLSLSLAGVTLAGSSLTISIEWVEE